MLSLINNLSALTAQNNLSNANNALNTSLQRLSSGLRINSGADDPAGLVISQIQQAQMSGLQTAITNTATDTNVAQTADGGLNQINALLVQIRGLAVAAANTGANDPNMLAADQAQITNALQTVTRIATSTQYGKEQLLDGSHAVTASVQGLGVTAQLTTGETGAVSATAQPGSTAGAYAVSVTQLATQANITGNETGGAAIAASASETLTINGNAIALNGGTNGLNASQVATAINQYQNQTGVTASVTSGNQIKLTSNAYGTVGNSYTVVESTGGTLGFGTTSQNLANGVNVAGTITPPGGSATAANGTGNVLSLSGAFGSVSVTVDPNSTNGSNPVSPTNPLAINVKVGAGGAETVTAAGTVNTASGTYTANITQLATQATVQGGDLTGQQVVGAGETDLLTINGVQIQLNGGAAGLDAYGAENIINQYTNQTGVTASVNTSGGEFLKLTSVGYGSTQQIKVEESGVTNPSNPSATPVGAGTEGLASATVTPGQDVKGTITDNNGNTYATTGSGNVLTAANGLTINTNPKGQLGDITTAVTNNSLAFQIGANAGQSANLAIQNMQSDALGLGVSNGSGIVNLSMIDVTNSNQSFSDILNVVDKAISDVSNLAGALGAFQDNTLQATAQNLQTSLQNTTAANSTIRDTNFAQESATFAQNQVLVQAGTQVLKNANQLPQLALALLQ